MLKIIYGSGTEKAAGVNKVNPVLLDGNKCILVFNKRQLEQWYLNLV
jgi:hypothetical protein